MQLRKGKTKTILENSIECALLAVEIYNKPRAPFRVESFITHMIMAWTKLFQAYFHHTIGDKFYFKNKNGRYEIFDGEKKAWELKTCIQKYGKLSDAQKANLFFFIRLRNKIEHRHIEKDEIGIVIFGECQSILFNYENKLIEFFGEDYVFCNRAREAGIEIWCDPLIQFSHAGKIGMLRDCLLQNQIKTSTDNTVYIGANE